MTLHLHHLTGCAPAPLANYLKALGILRPVAEQADPTAWDRGLPQLPPKRSSFPQPPGTGSLCGVFGAKCACPPRFRLEWQDREIADAFGMTVDGVRSSLKRSRQKVVTKRVTTGM